MHAGCMPRGMSYHLFLFADLSGVIAWCNLQLQGTVVHWWGTYRRTWHITGRLEGQKGRGQGWWSVRSDDHLVCSLNVCVSTRS